MVGWVEKEGPPSSGWMILVFQYFISWFCKPWIAAPSFHSETRSDVAFLVLEVFLNSLSWPEHNPSTFTVGVQRQ